MKSEKPNNLQGWVQFPTGGKAREQCDTADSVKLRSRQ